MRHLDQNGQIGLKSMILCSVILWMISQRSSTNFASFGECSSNSDQQNRYLQGEINQISQYPIHHKPATPWQLHVPSPKCTIVTHRGFDIAPSIPATEPDYNNNCAQFGHTTISSFFQATRFLIQMYIIIPSVSFNKKSWAHYQRVPSSHRQQPFKAVSHQFSQR